MTRSPWQDARLIKGEKVPTVCHRFHFRPGSLMAAVVIWKKASDRARAILLGLGCKVDLDVRPI